MIKKILLSAGVPIVLLVAIAGCGHGPAGSNSNAPDMTNVPAPPPVSSTNLSVNMPVANTNLLNTNLTTEATVTNKP